MSVCFLPLQTPLVVTVSKRTESEQILMAPKLVHLSLAALETELLETPAPLSLSFSLSLSRSLLSVFLLRMLAGTGGGSSLKLTLFSKLTFFLSRLALVVAMVWLSCCSMAIILALASEALPGPGVRTTLERRVRITLMRELDYTAGTFKS